MAARQRIEAGLEKRPWFRWLNKPASPDSCLATLVGHTGGINSCAYSPDGTRLVTASGDGTLKVWDPNVGGRDLGTLAGHSGGVIDCCYFPLGDRILSAGVDGTLRVWDATTYHQLGVMEASAIEACRIIGTDVWLAACACRPDGAQVAAATGGFEHRSVHGDVLTWDVSTGRLVARFPRAGASCCYSPGGESVIAPITGRIFATDSFDQPFTEMAAPLQPCVDGHALAWALSADGRTVATATGIWNARSGAKIMDLEVEPRVGGGETCTFSPDGRWIVFGRGWQPTFGMMGSERILAAGLVVEYETATGKVSAVHTGHARRVTRCAYSPDGTRIATSSLDGTARIWDAASRRRHAILSEGHARAVTDLLYNNRTRRFLSVSDSSVRSWDADTRSFSVAFEAGRDDTVTACACSAEGTTVTVGCASGALAQFDAASGALKRPLAGHQVDPLQGEFATIHACAYSPAGGQIASASADETITLWDSETGRKRRTLWGHQHSVDALAYSPDGRCIVSSASDGTLKVWDVETGIEDFTVKADPGGGSASAVAYSPDGAAIVSACSDGSLKTWDTADGTLRATMTGHTGDITRCVYSPDAAWIASGSSDGTCRIWNAHTGELIKTIGGYWCTFLPSQQCLLILGPHAVQLHDVVTWQNVATFPMNAQPLCAAVGRSGGTIAVGDHAGDVHLVELENTVVTPPPLVPTYRHQRGRGWYRELRARASLVVIAWLTGTLIAGWSLSASPFERMLTAPVYGLLLAYPALIVQAFLFAAPGLFSKERLMAAAAAVWAPLVILAALILISALLWPIEALWLRLVDGALPYSVLFLVAKAQLLLMGVGAAWATFSLAAYKTALSRQIYHPSRFKARIRRRILGGAMVWLAALFSPAVVSSALLAILVVGLTTMSLADRIEGLINTRLMAKKRPSIEVD